jgi:hypothetical protein
VAAGVGVFQVEQLGFASRWKPGDVPGAIGRLATDASIVLVITELLSPNEVQLGPREAARL